MKTILAFAFALCLVTGIASTSRAQSCTPTYSNCADPATYGLEGYTPWELALFQQVTFVPGTAIPWYVPDGLDGVGVDYSVVYYWQLSCHVVPCPASPTPIVTPIAPPTPPTGCTPAPPTPTPLATPTPTAPPAPAPTPTATRTPVGPFVILSPLPGETINCRLTVQLAMQPPAYLAYLYIDGTYSGEVFNAGSLTASFNPDNLVEFWPNGSQTLRFYVSNGSQNAYVADVSETLTVDMTAWEAAHNALGRACAKGEDTCAVGTSGYGCEENLGCSGRSPCTNPFSY